MLPDFVFFLSFQIGFFLAVWPSAWMDFHNQAGCVIVTLPRLSDNAALIYTYAKTCRTICNSYAIWGLLSSMRCMQSLAQMPVLRSQVSEAPCILTFLSAHTPDSLWPPRFIPPIRPRRKTHSFPVFHLKSSHGLHFVVLMDITGGSFHVPVPPATSLVSLTCSVAPWSVTISLYAAPCSGPMYPTSLLLLWEVPSQAR